MEVRNIINNEKGLFATKEYLVGDVIIQEKPLFIVGELISNDILSELFELKNSINDEISGYIKTNAIPMTSEKSGVFKVLSRCNHCCIPNARYFWNTIENQMYLIALKEINPNDEITISYGNTYFIPKILRQNHLRNWNFNCGCSDCKNNLTEEIRLKLYYLNNNFERNCSNEYFKEALGNAMDMLNVIKGTILDEVCLQSIIYYNIYQVQMFQNKYNIAQLYLNKYLSCISVCETSKSQNFIEKGRYLNNPQKFQYDRLCILII